MIEDNYQRRSWTNFIYKILIGRIIMKESDNSPHLDAVAFIPIRLASKRIKKKSILSLGGRPMFCWVAAALDRIGIPVYLYSSDIEILASLLDFEPEHLHLLPRNPSLDGDQVLGIDIYKAFAETIKAQVYLLAHCTSPFMSTESFRRVLDVVQSGQTDSALSVRRIQTFCWFKNRPINFDLPRIQTQRLEPLWSETSGAYAFTRNLLDQNRRTGSQPKLIEVSEYEAMDIDNVGDFELAQATISKLCRKDSLCAPENT